MKTVLYMGGEIAICVLLIVGLFLGVVSVIGMLRLPDAYTRAHAATKLTTLGMMCIVGGVFVYEMLHGRVAVRLLLVLVFLFATNPVASHVLGRAAMRSGVPLWQAEQKPRKKT